MVDLKKKSIVFSVILFIFTVLVIFVASITSKSSLSGNSIEEAINNYSDSKGNPIIIERIIEKVTVEKDTVLVFMLNENYSTVYYCIVKKHWNGKWMVKNLSGTPTTKHPGETNPYSYTNIISEDVNGYWGVIFDSNVEMIVLRSDKEEFATVVDSTNSNPFWYKVYQKSGEEMVNVEIVKAIDSKGNEVPWSSHD
jgi:hypothetical protein